MDLMVLLLSAGCSVLQATDQSPPTAAEPPRSGHVLLDEHFDRQDGSASADAIGNGWSSNSARRADGRKQAFLNNGRLTLKTAQGADHGVVIFQELPAPFQHGVVQVRFVAAEGTAFAVDLNDPMCKTVHSGHIANIAVTRRGLTIKDSKTGAMNLEHRRQLKAGTATAALKKQIAKTIQTVPLAFESGTAHLLTIVKCEDCLQVFVDGQRRASFRSPGFRHPTIRKISISVPSLAQRSPPLDRVTVRSLAADCPSLCR